MTAGARAVHTSALPAATVADLGEILTPDEVAGILKVPRRTIVRLCGERKLPGAFKVGRGWRVPTSAIAALVDVAVQEARAGRERVAEARTASGPPPPRALPPVVARDRASILALLPPSAARAGRR